MYDARTAAMASAGPDGGIRAMGSFPGVRANCTGYPPSGPPQPGSGYEESATYFRKVLVDQEVAGHCDGGALWRVYTGNSTSG